MHRCLFIPEIVQRICDEFGVGYAGCNTMRNRQLLALAQTCRFFSEPALACLWKSIPDLVALVKCLGRDMWETHRTFRGLELRLKRPLSQSDIDTIYKYAYMVRHFGTGHDESDVMISQDALHQIFKEVEAKLFPNLHCAHLKDESMAKFINLFSSQRLTALTLCLPSLDSEDASLPYASILRDFAKQSPNITSLELVMSDMISGHQGVAAALSTWQNLQSFRSTEITLESLQNVLHSSGSLLFLVFSSIFPSDDGFQDLMPPKGPDTPFFPVMEVLSIGLNNFSNAVRFVDYLSPKCRLQELVIKIHNSEPSRREIWFDLFQSVKRYSKTLNILHVEEGIRCFDDDDRAASVPRAVVLLVSEFTMLTNLFLSNIGGYDVSDEDLEEITKALPLLVIFGLVDHTAPSMIEFKATIASLVYFAQNCPFLSHLSLPFSARTDQVPRGLGSSIQGTELNQLDIAISPVDDPQLVANFIFDIFPNIEYIINDGEMVDELEADEDEPDHLAWVEIGEILRDRKGKMGRRNSSLSDSDLE